MSESNPPPTDPSSSPPDEPDTASGGSDAGGADAGGSESGGVETGELVSAMVAAAADDAEGEEATGSVTEPAKVMRIGSMVKQLLEEVRAAPLDEASRERLAEIYERSVVELSSSLSDDLQEELHMLALPFRDDVVPSEPELRIAQAQLVGWLEGLFHGIQATLFAQQVAARQQLEQMRQLPQGPGQPDQGGPQRRPGTYL